MPDAPKPESFERSLRRIVRESQARQPDADKAADRAIAKIRSTPGLLDGSMQYIVRATVKNLIYSFRTETHAEFRAVAVRETNFEAMDVAAQVANRSALMAILQDWFVGDKALGECDGEDLHAEARRLRLAAHSTVQTAKFYETLAGKIGNRRVGEAVKNSEVMAMLKEFASVKLVGGESQGRSEPLSKSAPRRSSKQPALAAKGA